MRDTTQWRLRINALRLELIAAWTEANPSLEKIGRVTAALREAHRENNPMNFVSANPPSAEPAISADAIAIACIAAAKETGCDPENIARGMLANGGRHSPALQVSRARAYAALALRAVFDDVAAPEIAGYVGSGSPACYCAGIDAQLKHRTLKWWSDDAFMRVIAAIEKHLGTK